AELAVEFGVHPTMISNWKQELVRRAGELFARGGKTPAGEDAQKGVDDLHPKVGQMQGGREFLAGQAALSPVLRGGGWVAWGAAGDDCAGSGAVRNPAMRAARGCAQQLLLPVAAGICGATRASEAARPDLHQSSSLRQPPAPGGAVARGDFDRPPTRPAAD